MISRQVVHGVLLAGAALAGALAIKWAQHSQIVSADIAERSGMAIIGLALAVYANFIPKSVPGLKVSPAKAARFQASLRLSGWIFSLAGLGYAAIWAFAPLSLAAQVSMAVVGGAVAVTLANMAYCLMSGGLNGANPTH